MEQQAVLGLYTGAYHDSEKKSGISKIIKRFKLPDNQLKEFTVEIEIKNNRKPYFVFENGLVFRSKNSFSSLGLKKKGKTKEEIKRLQTEMKKNYQAPYIRLGDLKFTNVKLKEYQYFEADEYHEKIERVLDYLNLDRYKYYREIYQTMLAGKKTKLDAFFKTLRLILLSEENLYIQKNESVEKNIRFASFALTKSPADSSFVNSFNQLKTKEISSLEFTKELVSHPNFTRMTNDFVYEWLHLKDIKLNLPDSRKNIDYYIHNLDEFFIEETEKYFHYIFKENRPLVELIQSDYSFINEDLNIIYNKNKSYKTGFVLRKSSHINLGGVLRQGSFLTATSNGIEGLPFKRAEWISENVYDKKIPPPPNNVSVIEFEEAKGSFEERMKIHSKHGQCNTCHKYLDPIANTMNNFNSIGVTLEDAASKMKKDLKIKEDKFVAAFSKKFIAYLKSNHLGIEDYDFIETLRYRDNLRSHEFLSEIIKHYF